MSHSPASTGNSRGPIRSFEGHSDPVISCAVSPDGTFVVSGGGDTRKVYGRQNEFILKVWDFESGADLFTLSGHEEAIKACAISRDSSFIISVAEDCMMVWDAHRGEVLNRFNHPGFACSSCTEDSTIAIVSFFSELLDFHSGEERISILTDDVLHDCAVKSDGSLIVTAGTDQHLQVWNTKNGEPIAALGPRADLDPYGDVTACAISPDGTFIVSGASDGMLRIWDAESLDEKAVLTGHEGDITDCDISHDNSMLVSSSWDGTLKVWEISTGDELTTLEGHTNTVNGCAFSPCSEYVVSAGGDTSVKVWNIADLGKRSTPGT